MLFLVATNVVASQPPERRPTGTPQARANDVKSLYTLVPAILMPRSQVKYRKFHQQVAMIEKKYGKVREECLAICLHRAEPNRFQIGNTNTGLSVCESIPRNHPRIIIRTIKGKNKRLFHFSFKAAGDLS